MDEQGIGPEREAREKNWVFVEDMIQLRVIKTMKYLKNTPHPTPYEEL